MSAGKRIIIALTKQQDELVERFVKDGIYTTKAEAIRDAVRMLIEQRKQRDSRRQGP